MEAGETVSRLGSSITSIALPLVAVLALGAGPIAAGLLTGAVWLPWLLFGLPAGTAECSAHWWPGRSAGAWAPRAECGSCWSPPRPSVC